MFGVWGSKSSFRQPLIVFAMPRTGSNYFLHLLRMHLGYSLIPEPFHPDTAYISRGSDFKEWARLFVLRRRSVGFSQFRHLWSVTSSRSDSYLIGYLRKNPVWSIELLQRVASRSIALKIFPEHLSSEAIVALSSSRSYDKVILVRNPLDTWLSVQKAQLIGQAYRVPTGNIRVAFDPSSFRDYCAYAHDWYSELRLLMPDAPIVSYEHLLIDNPISTLKNLSLGGLNRPRKTKGRQAPTLQDFQKSADAKVSNPAEMRAFLNSSSEALHRDFPCAFYDS